MNLTLHLMTQLSGMMLNLAQRCQSHHLEGLAFHVLRDQEYLSSARVGGDPLVREVREREAQVHQEVLKQIHLRRSGGEVCKLVLSIALLQARLIRALDAQCRVRQLQFKREELQIREI